MNYEYERQKLANKYANYLESRFEKYHINDLKDYVEENPLYRDIEGILLLRRYRQVNKAIENLNIVLSKNSQFSEREKSYAQKVAIKALRYAYIENEEISIKEILPKEARNLSMADYI